MPPRARLFFLADPSAGLQRGQGSQTYTPQSPQTAHKGTVVRVSGTASPAGFTIRALPSPLETSSGASFSADNRVQRQTLPSPPCICLLAVQRSRLSCFIAVVWSLQPPVKCRDIYNLGTCQAFGGAAFPEGSDSRGGGLLLTS